MTNDTRLPPPQRELSIDEQANNRTSADAAVGERHVTRRWRIVSNFLCIAKRARCSPADTVCIGMHAQRIRCMSCDRDHIGLPLAKVASNVSRYANAHAAISSSPTPMQNTLPARLSNAAISLSAPSPLIRRVSTSARDLLCRVDADRDLRGHDRGRCDRAAHSAIMSVPRRTAHQGFRRAQQRLQGKPLRNGNSEGVGAGCSIRGFDSYAEQWRSGRSASGQALGRRAGIRGTRGLLAFRRVQKGSEP